MEDHRVRVARERRLRMRRRLLDTLLATYRGDQQRGPAVLEDVLTSAEVSKATFYKYFQSLEAAVVELGEQLADEMAVAIVSNYQHVTKSDERLAIGFQLFLTRAALYPKWGKFVTHGAYLNPSHKLLIEVRTDFERGVANGDYVIDSIDAAVTLTIGAMVEGMRHVSQEPPAPDYIRRLTAMTLLAMGVPAAKAQATVVRAAGLLERGAQERFSWWKPL